MKPRPTLVSALLLLLTLPMVAESTGTLTIPVTFGALSAGQQNLSLFDQAFAAVATYINQREITTDVAANRPSASVKGRYYFATDSQILYVDTGSAWLTISSTPVYTDQLTGLTTANESSATATSVNVAAGAAASEDTAIGSRVLMTLASATAGNTAGTWVVGNYANKLDTGSIAANTTYHIWVIQRVDTGVTDILFSTSASAPTMPTNYSKRRRVGAFLTDAGSAIRQYNQYGDEFIWDKPHLQINTTDPGTAAITATLLVPTGIQVKALLNLGANDSTNLFSWYLSSLDSNDEPPVLNAAPLGSVLVGDTTSAGQFGGGPLGIWTNTSGQIRHRSSASGAANVIQAATVGWIDRRGRGCNLPC